jgi:putative endonuclease
VSTKRLYIGQTNNLEARVIKHNDYRNFSTKNRGQWKLVFHRSFNSRIEAMAFEKKLKSYKNKDYIFKKLNLSS